jgi:methyl-accepting chemotaxis protein
MSNLSLSSKVHVPLILSILIGLIIVIINYFYSVKSMEKDTYEEQQESLMSVYHAAIANKESVGLTNAINIAQNYSVIRALKENNREIALNGLNSISKEFKEYTNYKNIKVHIHDANVHSFFKSLVAK